MIDMPCLYMSGEQHKKIGEREPVFVLRAQDLVAPDGIARSLFILARAPGVAVAVYAAWHRDDWWRLRPAMERAAKRYAKRPVQDRKVDP